MGSEMCIRDSYDTTLTTGQIITSDVFPSHIDIGVYDFEGNQAKISFEILRDSAPSIISKPLDSIFQRFTPNDSIKGRSGFFNWTAPPGIVDKPTYLSFFNTADTLSIEAKNEVPLFKYLRLAYSSDTELPSNSIIATSDNKGNLKSLGCESKDSTTIKTYVIELSLIHI